MTPDTAPGPQRAIVAATILGVLLVAAGVIGFIAHRERLSSAAILTAGPGFVVLCFTQAARALSRR
ncbi:hypothetical protein [Actinoplanes sp. NPDC051851]|uniref:hypothetical protein n=1 Tax=Actinoplanes sp. NPDC051851 TaxID=3154753 RepID=UPI003437378B